MCTMERVWRSEDSLWELVPPHPRVPGAELQLAAPQQVPLPAEFCSFYTSVFTASQSESGVGYELRLTFVCGDIFWEDEISPSAPSALCQRTRAARESLFRPRICSSRRRVCVFADTPLFTSRFLSLSIAYYHSSLIFQPKILKQVSFCS